MPSYNILSEHQYHIYLPSLEFDKKFQTDVEYENFQDFKKTVTTKIVLNQWIDKFKDKLEEYLNEEIKSLSENLREKRCRDLDYWVRKVGVKISDLSGDPQLFDSILRFQEHIPAVFKKKRDYKCVRNDDSINNLEVRKKLDDYCENREYIHGLMKTENNKNFCLKYSKYIKENEIFFLNNEKSKCTNEYLKPKHCIINEKCTIENKTITFPEIKCEQYDISHDSEDNSMQKKLLLTTPIILGICALFLFLYKYTPLSSLLLNGNLKRKINDFVTEERQDILEDNEEYSPEYTENTESSIGYHMTSN
ncbi:PIR Superfamily Protein [Plasmodium ovale wallikeri]|uniref:PIR Superfamily Protein n=1 Tax=Plasmodium ovale wallikeri TaxID=864142 RepID=A0A1A9ATB9_PLAOA|nr:PIR Superfamily Protein [Plasmodium ovale wallikeri]SBT59408.1 PIR Superfamily Protein [Plasmodium ovale wallikeri]